MNNTPRKSLQEALRDAHNVDVIVAWLKEATLEEVEGFISNTNTRLEVHQHALNERDRRYALMARRPHWTLTPGFIVAVLAMVFAAIAAWPIIKSWF